MKHSVGRPDPWPDLGVSRTARLFLGVFCILGVGLVAAAVAFPPPPPPRPPARHPGLRHHTVRSSVSPQARATRAHARVDRERQAAHVNAHRQRLSGPRQEAAEQAHDTRRRTAMTVHADRREWEDLRRHVYYSRGDYYNLSCKRTVETIDDYLYYRCGSAWFERVYYEGQVIYVVIEPPDS